ncbi:MAG: poly-beta-1,6-N-acetyl-D-glucosamine biosynthesis protein PgaD [Pseudoxanthomonas sp.]
MKGYEHLIIHKPRSQPRVWRLTWRLVTVAFWALYFYLLQPLATLLLWLLGLRSAVVELYEPHNGPDFFLLYALPAITVLCWLLVIVWAEYNRLRFRGLDRRRPSQNVSLPQVAAALQAPEELAERLATTRVAVLHMDENARPIGLTERVLPPPR